MKTLSKVLIILSIIACNSDFEIPEATNKISNIETNTSMKSAISELNEVEENIVTFSEDNVIEGYVVSSDRAGNFFNELIIQDQPENPTTGIALQIDENSLFERFPFGSKIQIRLNGLSIAYQNGVIELGRQQENEIETLTEFLIDEHVFRTGEVTEITPLAIALTEIATSNQNIFIELNNMQFPNQFLEPTPITLAAENTDAFDGLRPIYNCDTDLEIQLSTSVFSSFKTMTIPEESGTIQGILTRDFDNLYYVLKMNSAENIQFSNPTRCESDFYECDTIEFIENTILFKEDFNTTTNENQLDELDWVNVNITGDEKRWTDKKITNIDNRVITLSAFNTNLKPLHVWLITPEVTISENTNSFVSIKLRTLFNNGDALKIWITNNYNGNIETANWQQLNIDLPNLSSNYVTFKTNISCVTGSVRLGLEYNGYDNILTSTYDIDEITFYNEE